jgi:transcriptional regulator with XRE-family HTH domain
MPKTNAEKEIIREFGLAVRQFRENRQLSQENFAELMGMSTRQLQKLEAGLPKTSVISLLRLLGLMKPETRIAFQEKIVPKAQKKFGLRPLRRADTSH